MAKRGFRKAAQAMNSPPKGRAAGSKNLKKNEQGNWVNQYGVEITPEQRKFMENSVAALNRKRAKMEKETAPQTLRYAGQEIGGTLQDMRLMGREDILLQAKQSASFQRFRDQDQFTTYLKKLQDMKDPDYLHQKAVEYKRNWQKSFERTYGKHYAKDVQMRVRMMKPEDFVKLANTDETLQIGYNYGKESANNKIVNIRAALSMKQKDYEEDFDEFSF